MVYGIDLGTTNTIIGYNGELFSDLIKSSVDFKNKKQCSDLSNPNIVRSYKKQMTIQPTNPGKVAIEASRIILEEAVKQANNKTGANSNKVVISVPAAFTQLQRQGTLEAGRQAGLEVLRLIDEPTAACIAAGAKEPGIYLVIDVGGGTSDISIVDNTSGVYVVKATYGEFLGGDDLDDYIIDNYFVGNIVNVVQSAEPDTRNRLKILAENFKCTIKEGSEIDISGEEFGTSKIVTLDYSDLENAIEEVFKPVLKCIESALSVVNNDTKIKTLFVGGSCRGEAVRNLFKKYIKLNYVDIDIDRYNAVAIGVSIFAKMVEDGTYADYIQPISKRILLKSSIDNTDETLSYEVIKPNLNIPVTVEKIYEVEKEGKNVKFDVYTGDGLSFKECIYEGTIDFSVSNTSPSKVGTQLFITFDLDLDNVLHLSSENLDTGFTSEGKLEFK